MRRQITRISVGQTSKVIASLYFVVAVVFAVIYFIGISAMGTNTFNPMLILLFPIIYGVIIWVVIACMLWVYNQVAPRIGGVEFESVDVGSTP
jgi:ammonia channel protein AmtB